MPVSSDLTTRCPNSKRAMLLGPGSGTGAAVEAVSEINSWGMGFLVACGVYFDEFKRAAIVKLKPTSENRVCLERA
jgi:hypothetical protein